MRIRSFVALPLSVALTRRLVDEVATRRAALGAQVAQQIAWVPAANLHVTVKFLGSIQEEAAGAIRDRLRSCVADLAPVELRLTGFGAFPAADDAHVLWAGVAATPALLVLAAAVERELVAFGLDAETRAYHPHVTVGRLRKDVAPLGAALTNFFGDAAIAIGSGAANELVLYESRTPKAGVEYVRLGQVALGTGSKPRERRDPKDANLVNINAVSKET